ncbi:hypothetical protein [Cystobacter fuscus]|uniref:hypothetical protein n=1 Tax=Cystobacter fuscus TaxID=43 RepID=UPI002B2F52C8|nr:hypothetical protein F0U63_24685 [Cystobacter fuscus]
MTLDKSAGGSATLGSMCHIVGESTKGPRGHSNLTLQERNSYSNLILLCNHHHNIIDTDVKKYSVETLHKIKSDHELWVEESLASSKPDPDTLVYSDLIDTISTSLQLGSWNWFVDGAVRELIHHSIYDARGTLNAKLLSAVWPRRKVELRNAIKEVINGFDDYVTHFGLHCQLRPDGYLGPDTSWKSSGWNPNYDEDASKEDLWAKKGFWLLCRFTYRLNEFSDAVRKHFNPLFFRTRGYFLILDHLGVHSGGRPTMFRPTKELLARMQTRVKKAEREFRTKARRGEFAVVPRPMNIK